MLPSLLLSLREGLEAALIIGIVLGALRKIDRKDLSRFVWSGFSAAALVSIFVAVGLFTLGASLEGVTEAIFEGITMLFAAAVLTWMIFWMQSQVHSIRQNLESDVRRASLITGGRGLFMLAFLAVVREGIELALFLTAATFTSTALGTLSGALIGLLISAVLGWLLFTTTLRLNVRRFFQVTSALLILFAGGLIAYGFHEFIEAGLIPAIIDPVWNINHIFNENSTLGLIMKSLFGYNGNPALTEIFAYFAFFGILFVGLQLQKIRLTSAKEVHQAGS